MPLITQIEFPGGGLPVKSLIEYLTMDRTLVIPPWQREYSWSTAEDEQIDTLLKDLKSFVENKNSNEYLLGSIVLCELPDDKQRPLLIDGQQRTLTLSLLLMCIRKFLRSNNLIDGNNAMDTLLDSEITSALDKNPWGQMSSRVSMKQSSADETLARIYEWSHKAGPYNKNDLADIDVKNATQENLISAVEFIYKKIAGFERKNKGVSQQVLGDWVATESIKEAVRKILKGVKLIEIRVNDKRESISVFDHINNRGLNLNPADLVKNLMFEKVDDKEFGTISDNWIAMCELMLLNKKARLQDPRYLLRAISHVEYGAHEGYDGLDIFWNKKFGDTVNGVTPKEFSNKLPRYASDLKELVARSESFRGGLSSIYLSGELGSVQHYSVLLAGHKLKSDQTFQFLCHQVNIRTLVYMFAEERTQLFDSMIPGWANAVFNLPSEASIEELKKVFEGIKPSDSLLKDLKERMLDWNYLIPSQRKKIRATLGLLSYHLNESCGQRVRIEDVMRTRKSKGNPEPFVMDHVLPQAKSNKLSIFQTIGNLTLLEPVPNLSALDDDPTLKKDFYSQCGLFLTRSLNGFDVNVQTQTKVLTNLGKSLGQETPKWDLKNWNDSAVVSRGEFMYEYFCKIVESCWK